MYVGDTYTIEALLENADNQILYKVIEGNNLISLDGKVVTAISEGTAVVEITVDGLSELKKELIITVSKKAEPPHEHNFVEGKCECGETDPSYIPPHVHEFIEGKCECGETDPNYVPPHVHEFIEGKCECGETDPNYVHHTFMNL
jgi:hypothetical protein